MVQAVVQTTVTGIQGQPISATPPTSQQALTWSGTAWVGGGPYLPLTGGAISGLLTLNAGSPTTNALLIPNGNVTLTAGAINAVGGSLGGSGGQVLVIGTNGGISSTFTGNNTFSGGITTAAVLTADGITIPNNPSANFAMGSRNAGLASWSLWSGSNFFYFNSSGGSAPTPMYVDVNGNFYAAAQGWKPGGGSWADSSDSRIKNVSGGYNKGLADLVQLVPKEFTYLGNDTMFAPETGESAPYPQSGHYSVAQSEKVFSGLLAQDMETIFPECVTLATAYIGGAEVTDLRELDTTPLIYAIINALKEIVTRLVTLESHDNITPAAGSATKVAPAMA
jgi:trimeric autotransporter adhesin